MPSGEFFDTVKCSYGKTRMSTYFTFIMILEFYEFSYDLPSQVALKQTEIVGEILKHVSNGFSS